MVILKLIIEPTVKWPVALLVKHIRKLIDKVVFGPTTKLTPELPPQVVPQLIIS